MGIESYLVSSTVSIAIGQRLVRKICRHCKEKIPVTEAMAEAVSSLPLIKPFNLGKILYKGKGCNECNGSGYTGRLCINEVLVADNDVKEAILRKASSSEIKRVGIQNGMTSMVEDGLKKALNGDTTIEEILRVVRE
jgi:general secretion pathway protein E